MDIYLIRHTQTANVEGLCYGQSDLGLAISFPEEVEVLHQQTAAGGELGLQLGTSRYCAIRSNSESPRQ